MLTINKKLISNEAGDFIQYQPVLNGIGNCTFSGEIGFAAWDVEIGQPDHVHADARAKAIANAKEVLGIIARS
jgi:hypothetical protein